VAVTFRLVEYDVLNTGRPRKGLSPTIEAAAGRVTFSPAGRDEDEENRRKRLRIENPAIRRLPESLWPGRPRMDAV
jgi:hypothetical protein